MSRASAQTALSDGFGPAWADFADAVDIASLAHARRRHMRRQAMDAVDHLIALLDALDADGEDREPDADGGEADDVDLEDDGTAEPSLGAPECHPTAPVVSHHYRTEDGRQRLWAAGSARDGEEDINDAPQDEDELDDDGISRGEGDDADLEATAPERAGKGFLRCREDDAEDDDPAERDDHHGCESEPHPWRFWPDAWVVQAQSSEPVRLVEVNHV